MMNTMLNIQLKRRYIYLLFVAFVLFWFFQFTGAMAAPPAQDPQDIGVILDPPNNGSVRGVVEIIGSADHPTFQFYVIEVSPQDQEAWQFLADGSTAVLNGPLATWDTNTLPDGVYRLRLRVVRVDGNYAESFVQEVTISNAQPLPTDTPTPTETPDPAELTPTVTPTPLPPTPTIVIEQPIVDTPTPRPVDTSEPLEDPEENTSLIPEVSNFSVLPLRDACLYGGAVMLGVFLLFGFLSSLRIFIKGFADRFRRRRD